MATAAWPGRTGHGRLFQPLQAAWLTLGLCCEWSINIIECYINISMAFGLIGIIVGIFLLLVGIFLVFFFPGTPEHQTPQFGAVGVVFGFLLLVIGGALIFL